MKGFTKMLHDIAITPDVFQYASSDQNGKRELEALWKHFEENVLIANLQNGEWARHIGNLELSPAVKDQVLCQLKKFHSSHRMFDCPPSHSDSSKTVDWFLESIRLIKQGMIHAVVTCESTRLEKNISHHNIIDFPVNTGDYYIDRIKKTQQANLTKKLSNMQDVLEPFLRHARIVKMIDPYIVSGKQKAISSEPQINDYRRNRHRNIIDLIANLLGHYAGRRTPGRIEIYTSINKSDAKKRREEMEKDIVQYREEWEAFLSVLSQKYYTHNISITLLDKDNYDHYLHDRYILTDQAGIMLPAGIEEQETKEENWVLLQEDKWRSEYQKYTSKIPFRIEKQISFALKPATRT